MDSQTGTDVYICHVKEDEQLALYLSEKLSENNLAVWHKHGADINTKGKALFQAKTVLMVISRDSIKSKFCNDELSLAYVSDKPIFPVTTEDYKAIEPSLNFSMKLIVSKLNWSFFPWKDNKSFCEDQLPIFLKSIKRMLGHRKEQLDRKLSEASPKTNTDGNSNDATETEVGRSAMNRWRDFVQQVHDLKVDRKDFWIEHFGEENKEAVPWHVFRAAFMKAYKEQIVSQFSEERCSWLINVMYGDIFQLRKTIDKSIYNKFCGHKMGDPDRFFHRLLDYASGKMAMKEVFEMDSTVRLIAIENMAQFKTPAVILALLKLLTDKDANMKAVAAIALGKTEIKEPHVRKNLMRILKDEDRMVRAAACLSLGHLKANEAVKQIADLWRNDIISDVRNAALTALKLIDSKEAHEAIRVTQLLADEVNELKRNIASND